MSKKSSSFLRHLNRNRKAPRSTLRVEPLESRQLWAVVEGAGTEVVHNVTNSDGVTYDQVLMTGPSVSVTNDAGQVTRVSFLDNDGDIVQVALIGPGKLNVSLDDHTAGVLPTGYNAAAQAYSYVQGDATITISGPIDESSSLEVYSVGAARNPGVVDATHQGGDHWADISRVIIVGNEQNEAGYTNFGSIRTGNAFFSADTGVVGIRAENVAVQGVVRIGDIDATESGVPTLYFNSNSQFQNVFVQGGDLKQTNGASFDTFGNGNAGGTGNNSSAGGVTLGGFAFFNSINGQDSQGNLLWSQPVNQDAIRLASVDQQTLMSGDWVFGLDAITGRVTSAMQNGVDVTTGLIGSQLTSQNSLDAAFAGRTFTGNITIEGDLFAGLEINMADARGNVTFADDLFGSFIVDGYGAGIDGTLTVEGNLDGHVLVRGSDRVTGGGDGQNNKINGLVVEGSTGAFSDIRAEEIGNVVVRHDFSGVLSTNVRSGDPLSVPGVSTIEWNGTQRTSTGYVDIDGKIGNVTVGMTAAGVSNGGSIKNGTVQGMSGIGNVMVGGDIYGSAPGQGVFVTSSNAGAASTDVRNYGSANIGTLTVHGDVDLDTPSQRLIYIAGNGIYGNVLVEGVQTTAVVPGEFINNTIENVLIPDSEVFVRILSPFIPADLVIATTPAATLAAAGTLLVNNYDPDVAGPLNSDYIVNAADVAAGAQIYTIMPDGTLGALVDAVVGDRVPAVVGLAPARDAFGNILYVQNTALLQGEFEEVITPHYGPDVTTIVSGNRGNLNGVYNNFGSIEIAGLLGAQQPTTGTITWTDSVDMTFGGVTVNSTGVQNQGVVGSAGTIGAITINNVSGATSDLQFTGVIGSKASTADINSGTAFVALAGLTATGFEDVVFNDIANRTNIIHATQINNGISVTTVAGVGNGFGAGTVSPSVTFNDGILLSDGTTEGAQNALLTINTGMVNSKISFAATSSIIVDNGANTGNVSSIAPISLSADYVNFAGELSARSIGAITLTGGTGILSGTDTAVSFTGKITADTVASVTASATEGNVIFAPADIVASSTVPAVDLNGVSKATVGAISLSTIGTNNGGDITLGNAAEYNADFGPITLAAGHKLFLSQAGTVIDNPGDIAINLATTGNIGNLIATTTTGNINNALTVQGNAGDITYTAGVAVVAGADLYAGAVGDLVQAGSIFANQTIWGTRGVTTMEVAGQNADGTAAPLAPFTVNGVTYTVLPAGSIEATLNYAGSSTASGNAFIAKTGAGSAEINYNIIGHDDNNNGVVAISEIGNGGNALVQSVSGDITFAGGTQLTDFTHVATLGNVALSTGAYAQANGKIAADQKGDITLSFNDLAGVPATGGFEGSVGNISATTTAGDVTFAQSRFDGAVGNVTLASGAVAHTSGVMAGAITTTGTGVTFNAGQGLVMATTTDVGTMNVQFTSNGTSATGYELTTQYGALTANIGAGSYDANNNTLITANEYGRTGDLELTSAGGVIGLTLSSSAYVSVLEQSMIGDITIANSAFIGVKNGAADTIGSGTTALGSVIPVGVANGNITITGNAQVGAVGDITATTNVGLITQDGVFGDLGATTFTTTSYFDLDTVANTTAEAPALLGDGDIALDAEVNGAHDLATYTVEENGAISGNLTYGGQASSANSIIASSVRGNITLGITLQDADRDLSGNITNTVTNPEFGTIGATSFTTTSGGDVALTLGTTQNNATLDKQALVPEFTFGAITVNVADRYTSTSATAADVLAAAGDITITGTGENIATGFGAANVNRGTIASIAANVTRGDIVLTGNFGSLLAQNLTATRYLDVDSATVTNAIVGNINYSPSIWGEHGTATLRIDDTGASAAGAITTGAITGTATFGGDIVTGSTVSVDAKNGRGGITLDVIAKGYDLNQDALVTDGDANNIPALNEFAKVGDVVAETTNAGDILLGIGTNTANGSTVGSVIGNVSATANDDIYTVTANADDVAANLANATVVGKSSVPLTAGTVGNITIAVNTGVAGLSGNFVNIGSVGITTGIYTDTSAVGNVSKIIDAGDIALGLVAGYGAAVNADLNPAGGFDSLNIAGTYANSTLTVAEMGSITGAVYVAGAAGNTWSLNANYGQINVGFVAGFDADASGGALSASEAGKLGDLTATSVYGNVTLAVGGRGADSVIGNVSVTTGDLVTTKVGTVDPLATGNDTIVSGLGTITGISGAGLGSVGNLINSVKSGVATLDGTFGGIGNATFTTDVVIDLDSIAVLTENRVIQKAGDIALAANVYGSHGTLNLTTVDTSKVAAVNDLTAIVAPQTTVATLDKVAGVIANTGDITGTIGFSGGLNATVTDGIVAKSDRGTINLVITSGIDEANAGVQDANEAGSVGNVSFTSIDGDVTANLNIRNSISSIGNVTLNTGSTYATKQEAADTLISEGDATITSNDLGLNGQNYGTIGNIAVTTLTGANTFGGVYNNLGTVTLSGSRYADADTAIGGSEPTLTIGAADVSATATVRGTHNTFTLTAIDDATNGTTPGGAAAVGNVSATLVFTGSLASGTNSLVASAQQGTVTASVTAGTYANIVDGTAAIAADLGTTNSDNRVGVVGNVTLASLYNNVTATLVSAAPVAKILAADVVRTPTLGNISATAGSSYSGVAAGVDTLVSAGAVTITNNSLGSIGNITGLTTTGAITLNGASSNVVGNISLTSGFYSDADNAPGLGEPALVLAAGSISHATVYGAASSTTIGTVSMAATGSITDAGLGAAGSISDTHVSTSVWTDAGVVGQIEAGELTTVTFGATTATVTDGTITYSPTTAGGGYGVKFDNVTLTSNGGSVFGTTGDITVGGVGIYSQVSNLTASAGTADVLFSGTYEAPTISAITLRSLSGNGVPATGDVTLSGALNLGFANATNNRTTNVSVSGVTVQADNGNVLVSGSIGENINYGAGFIVATGNADARTATISGVLLTASNGAVNDTTNDGNVTLSGRIGTQDITRVVDVTLTAGNTINDTATFSSAGVSNIEAQQIGTIVTNGTTTFVNAAAANILATDDATTRQYIGTVDYTVATAAGVAGKGSILNKIDTITFNGAVIGGAASLTTGTVGEVMASQIGNVTVAANVSPSSSVLRSVTDFDISANPMPGELIASTAAAAAAAPALNSATNTGKFSALSSYSIGNVSITHNLLESMVGSSVFAGSSVFVAGGKMGNLTINSTINGAVQAPLFAALAGNAWFNVGDINGTLGTADTINGATAVALITETGYQDKTTNGTALVALPEAVWTVGNVSVNAGGPIDVYPNPVDGEITNAQRFALAVGVDANAAGNYYSAAGAEAVEISGGNSATLYGRVGNVTVQNAWFTPDGYNSPAEPVTAVQPGAIVVSGDGLAGAEILDMVNELNPGGVPTALVPMSEGQYYLVGDLDTDDLPNGNDIMVYVL